MKINYLLSICMVSTQYLCAMEPDLRLKLPTATQITNGISRIKGLEYFAEKSTLAREIGGKLMLPEVIPLAVVQATERYVQSLLAREMSSNMVKSQEALIYTNLNLIIKTILQNYPEQYEKLMHDFEQEEAKVILQRAQSEFFHK